MKILIFGNKTCPKCTVVKENINRYIKKWKLQDTTKIVYYDIDTVDGLAECAYLDVMGIPTVIVIRDDPMFIIEIKRWTDKIPPLNELKEVLTC